MLQQRVSTCRGLKVWLLLNKGGVWLPAATQSKLVRQTQVK